MPIYSACRRTSDGRLDGFQSNNSLPPLWLPRLVETEPGVFEEVFDVPAAYQTKLANYTALYGGTWEQFQLTDAAYATAHDAYQAGQAAFASGTYPNISVTNAASPLLSITDVTGTVYTLECNTGDTGYTGAIVWELEAPDASIQNGSESAVSGVSTCEITAGQVGVYRAAVDAATFGKSEISFEVK